jgi:hypothetical protein
MLGVLLCEQDLRVLRRLPHGVFQSLLLDIPSSKSNFPQLQPW